MCPLVTYTVQLNPSLHVYFISDKIVLRCVKTHDSRITFRTEHYFVYHSLHLDIFICLEKELFWQKKTETVIESATKWHELEVPASVVIAERCQLSSLIFPGTALPVSNGLQGNYGQLGPCQVGPHKTRPMPTRPKFI